MTFSRSASSASSVAASSIYLSVVRCLLLLAGAFSLLAPSGCTQHIQPKTGAPIVRVQLLAAQQKVTLASSSPPTLRAAGQSGSLPASNVDVSLSSAGWQVGGERFPMGELAIVPNPAGSVAINGKPYRGSYRLVPTGPDKFDVVNDVDIDSYLCGVLASELFKDWHIEAYKAQAITARTYALYEAKTAPSGRSFDIYDDTRSQVYGGISAETAKSVAAAGETAGIVLAYGPAGKEKIFKAYFSSCCGGIGQSAADAFNEADIPPLREKNVGTLCSISNHYTWPAVTLSKAELTRRIRAWGAKTGQPEKDLGELRSADIASVNRYGRPVRFYLTDSKNLRYTLLAEQFRWACNADAKGGPTIYSSYVRPVTQPDSIAFVDGHGYGHGVGLCQWCAQARALRGEGHEDIVRLAFPSAQLIRAY